MSRLSPLDYPICFAQPLRIAPSAWLTHVPFGMFLVDLLRPGTLVELGTDYGVSYCAFCQAVASLRLPTRCFAVDTWQGDPQTRYYGADVLADLMRHHDPLYSGFSTLIQSTFDEAVARFPDASIDLLHIDGYHTYEAVRHDYETWLPKMSPRGVVLFHDTQVRERDFGVWKLWDELCARHPSFEFLHGHGLGVLSVGSNCPPGLDLLLGDPDATLRDFFSQLGLRVEQAEALQSLHREAAALTSRLEASQQQVSLLSAQLDAIKNGRIWRVGMFFHRWKNRLLGRAS